MTLDTGTAYGRPARQYKQHLVEVGPGTPMGELMRRYWQPVFGSSELTSDRPRRIRILGENLILFRDKQGRAGLVAENCCHRGTSLFFGRIEDDGIRCCYHGWKFDVEGRCLEQPCEVDKGRNRDKVRQPWYPVKEQYGLVYAYMGPAEKKPVLQRWQHLEDLGADEEIVVRYESPVGYLNSDYDLKTTNFNWLQAFENTMDAPHLPWLHYQHSGDQFSGLPYAPGAPVPPYADPTNLVARMIVERTECGVKQGATMPGPGGVTVFGANEAVVPNVATIQDFVDLAHFVPVDDTHYIVFALWRSKKGVNRGSLGEMHGDRPWGALSELEHQLSPGDFEAQSSIGQLPAHNWEHLTAGDAALGMLRRRLEEAVRDVQEGRDPPGVSFNQDAPPRQTRGHKVMPYVAAAE